MKTTKIKKILIPLLFLFILLAGCGNFTEKPKEKIGEATVQVVCHEAVAEKKKSNLSDEVARKIPDDGVILKEVIVDVEQDDTVFDLTRKAIGEQDLSLSYQGSPSLGTAYIDGIGGLYAKDCGKNSGWTYRVNGDFIMESCSKHPAEKNDKIIWEYVTTYREKE